MPLTSNFAMAIAFAYLTLLVLCLLTKNKHIGIDAIGVCQTAFFGLLIVEDWHPILYSFISLGYSNGYQGALPSTEPMNTPKRL